MYIDQRKLATSLENPRALPWAPKNRRKLPKGSTGRRPKETRLRRGVFSDVWRAENDPKLGPKSFCIMNHVEIFLVLYSFEHVLLCFVFKTSEISIAFHCL